jgi:hypothetical protein
VGSACIELGSPLSCRSARGFVVSVVGLQPHVESSHRRKVDQRDEAVRQMISPDLDAEATTVHAAEQSAIELLVGYGGPRDPHGPPLLRSELDAFALERLNAEYRSKVRPPTFSVDTPPDIHWTGAHRGGNWIIHLNPSQFSRWTVLHEMARWRVPFRRTRRAILHSALPPRRRRIGWRKGAPDTKVCEVRRTDRGVSMMTAVSLSVASSVACV